MMKALLRPDNSTALLTCWLLFASTGCEGPAERLTNGPGGALEPDAPDGAALAVVEAQFESFNARDVDALAERVAPDFVWLSVEADSVRAELRGREAFREEMREYFRVLPSVRSSIESATATDGLVAFRERVRWQNAQGEERSQSVLGVYQVADGMIQRAWYYPSQP